MELEQTWNKMELELN